MPIGDVSVHPLNVRMIRPPENVARLAGSMKREGMKYPLKVTADPRDPTKFLCWDGGYRLAAAKLAGMTEVRIDVEDAKDETELIIWSFNAADKTVPLNPIEEATTFKVLWGRLGKLGAVCEAVGRGSVYVNDRLALLRLVPPARKMVLEGTMTIRPALRLSKEPKDVQEKALQIIQGPSFLGRHPFCVNQYTLYYVDDAIAEAKGKQEKKIYPEAVGVRGKAEWACPHCGGRFNVTCSKDGKHFFERVAG